MAYDWDMPKGTRRWHLFRPFSYLSLCGKWSSSDHDQRVETDGLLVARKRDCKACVRMYNKIKQEYRR